MKLKGMNPMFYIALVLGLTIGMYLLRPDQSFFNTLSKYDTYGYQYLFDNIKASLFRWDGILSLGIIGVATYFFFPQNFSYVFLGSIAMILLNAFVFPISYITNSGLPEVVILMIRIFFNVATMLAVVAFLSSRSG